MGLVPYSPKTACAKCGFDQPSSQYVAASIKVEINGTGSSSPEESIVRGCSRCGYQWRESVLA